jgi:hypothetical protein
VGEDAEDQFELPRKFQAGVIRRRRTSPAAVAQLKTASADSGDPWQTPSWQSIDLIVARHGVAAAVREFAAFSAKSANFAKHSWSHWSPYESPVRDARWSPMLRLLDLVRSASDEDYAEAMVTAEKMRAEYPASASRAAMSVLALDEPQWCSADIADYSADDDEHQLIARLLMVATTTREQARELGSRIRHWQWINDDRRAEGTFLATIDAGADAFLIGCVEHSRWHAFNLLPKLPSERAVQALIDELGPRDAQAALLEAAKRFPRRVLRLLAAEEPATQVDYVLRLHVAANVEMARAELAQLSGVARQRVEALLNAAGAGAGAGDGAEPAIPVAADTELPRILVIPPWKDPEFGRPTALKDLPAPVPFFCWPARDQRRSLDVPEPARSPEQAGNQIEILHAMSQWLGAERRDVADAAAAFYRRHPAEAVRHTLPIALGPLGYDRKAAEVAVRFVAREGLADVVAIAAEFGPDAERAIQTLLDWNGLEAFPKSMPAVPLWADPASLPGILLKGRRAALPASAVGFVVQMLTISDRHAIAPYTGIAIIKETCDAASLAEFAWGLFENWGAAGYLTKNLGWAFDTLLWFGDEETVRRLMPLIRAWPGQGGSARAATALNIVTAIGGEDGLREVYDLSQRSPFASLRTEASDRIAKAAKERGLSTDQLEDRLVLDLGVGPDGTLPLDYGARQFTAAFDDFLLPHVVDAAGKRRSTLPKPGAKDDAESAAAAQQRFAELKKDAKTFAMRQAERLEAAMVAGRGWSGAEFQRLFVEHPLLRRFARRLVWGEFDGAGELRAAFRIAEDGTFADVADERYELSPDLAAGVGVIGLPHPLDLGADLPRWAEICHDYEIIQPFPQVGRPVFALTDAERGALRLDRFCGVELPTDRFLALYRSPGWGGVGEWNAGSVAGTGRRLDEDKILIVHVKPGFREGRLADTPEQTITDVWICPTDASGRRAARTDGMRFGVLDEVQASEILADLTVAAGG